MNNNNNSNVNRFELVYTTDKTFETRQLANEYIRNLGVWKFQRTRCTKKGAKCFYMCKLSKFCKSKMYVLTQPNTEKVILYINNIDHDHNNSSNNGATQRSIISDNNNYYSQHKTSDNCSDMMDNDLFNENSNDFFSNNNNNGNVGLFLKLTVSNPNIRMIHQKKFERKTFLTLTMGSR